MRTFKCFVLTVGWLFLAAGAWLIVGSADAQVAAPVQKQESREVTVVDAAGRSHKIMKMHAVTQEQRQAAAKRKKGAAGKKKTGTTPKGGVKQ